MSAAMMSNPPTGKLSTREVMTSEWINHRMQVILGNHLDILDHNPEVLIPTFMYITMLNGNIRCDMCSKWTLEYSYQYSHLHGTPSSFRQARSRVCYDCKTVLARYINDKDLISAIKNDTDLIVRRARSLGHQFSGVRFGIRCMICLDVSKYGIVFKHRKSSEYSICLSCKTTSFATQCEPAYMALRALLLPEIAVQIVTLMFQLEF